MASYKANKLLMVCARIPFPIVDGGAHAIYTMIQALYNEGLDLHVATYSSSKHEQNIEGINRYACTSVLPKMNNPYGASDFLKSVLHQKPASILSRFDESLFKKIVKPFAGIEFDTIIYAGLQTCAHLPFLKSSYPNARHILYQVNIEHLLYHRIANGERNLIKRLAYKAQARLMKKFEFDALKAVDQVIFISPKDQRFFIGELGKLHSTALLPPSLTVPKKPIKAPNTNTICAYADWRWAPNAQGLAWFFRTIWPQIKKAVPTTEMNIAGKHLNSELLAIVNQLEGVHYLGFVDDLTAFINSSDLLVAPLPSGSGIKIKLVEAMAHSLAFVTTEIGFEGFNSPGIEEQCVAKNEPDFADKCIALLTDSNRNNALRNTIYDYASTHLDPANYSESLKDFIS